MPSTKIFCQIISLFLVIVCNGCADPATNSVSRSIKIDKVPPPEILAEEGKPKLAPAGYLSLRLQRGYPSLRNILINDRQYVFITEKWFRQIIDLVETYIDQQVPDLKTMGKYPLAYDSTLASMTSNLANLAVAKRYNLSASVLIGIMHAKSVKPWDAISADGNNRGYIVVLAEKGVVVYDIRTKQTILFESFPNLDYIEGIAF